jgi:GT2 family glycosyltransferase
VKWSIETTADLPYELIVSESESSVAINRNRGLERATQDHVFFIDDDVLLSPFWASIMVNALQSLPEAGVIAPQMVGPSGEAQNGLAGLSRDDCASCIPPGTLFVYDRRVLSDCRFDETYISSQWEDTDFMMQVAAKGFKCWAVGAVRIIHENLWTRNNDQTWAFNKAHFESKWGPRA